MTQKYSVMSRPNLTGGEEETAAFYDPERPPSKPGRKPVPMTKIVADRVFKQVVEDRNASFRSILRTAPQIVTYEDAILIGLGVIHE